MTLIRPLLAALSLMALVPMIDAAPADAQTANCRAWCRERSDGARNCGFISYEQCMWTAYGADICMPNGACPPPARTPLRHGR